MFNKKRLKSFNLLLVISMILSSIVSIPFNVLAIQYDDHNQEMSITEDELTNATEYDTYYYSENINYVYNGDAVEFTTENTIEINGEEFPLKNKKIDINIEQIDETVDISLSNLTTPVASIPGAWNSSYEGVIEIVYESNIPGFEEIRSSSLTKPISLSGVTPGEYTLTNGKIYEKANKWSPGFDFGDGNGRVAERNFGTLPNIQVKVGKELTSTSSSSEETSESTEDSSTDEDDSDPSLTSGYLGTKTESRVYDDFQNDIWLQYQQKALEVNETVDLRPWRIDQIISSGVANDVARPNFNFEIISGDSVTLSETKSNEKTQIKAVKPGTSVVKVTYDELDYKGKNWGAISPINTGYAVFVVGQTGEASINLSDELMNWRHYDTIYYSEGETTPYDFEVDAKNAKDVRVLVNGIQISGDGNKYTANLENRSNIISVEATDNNGKISSIHRVVDARFIEVNIENKSNSGKEFVIGDTAKISFRGINLPVQKLATIYNPAPNGWGGKGSFVEYYNEALGELKGRSGQYDLATKNSFEVELKEAIEYKFTSPNGIFTSWWGSKLGSDLTAAGPGEPNLNADVLEGYFSKMPDFSINVKNKDIKEPSIEEGYLGTKTEARIYDDFENDLWLQYQQKTLKVDETVDLRPWRVEQAVSNVIANDVARPNFNFEIISGDSVTLSETKSNEKTQIKAVKPGTSVVKVTYDELDYKGKNWGAISPINTGYAVFVVGQTGEASINLSDELMNWRHYDTIYYSEGETTPYDFEVDAKNAKDVRVLVNGIQISGDGNKYTANLENRSNIISVEATDNNGKISSIHRVVDARFININVDNITNTNKDISAGDTAKISFKGITLPVYKLATIYNPQWGGKNFVEYSNEKLGVFKGVAGQWDLATKNSFNVTFEEAGDYKFTSEKGIHSAWWGSPLGSDLGAKGPGEPNLNAPTEEDYFSKMPSFVVNVKDSTVKPSISLNKELVEINIGETEKLTATVKPENETEKVRWKSANEKIAIVSNNGEITGKKAGETEVTASVGSINVSTKVIVKETAADKELREYKENAIQTLGSYTDTKEYRKAQQREIESILKFSQQEINQSKDKVSVDSIVEETKAKLDTLKTDAELVAEEKSGDFVTFSIEKFTLGQGFILDPVRVPYKENENMAQLFDRVTKANKLEYTHAGTIEKDFYLEKIKNVDTLKINVPTYISQKLDGPTTEDALKFGKKHKDLGEFDYSEGSGWYYLVNGTAADVGMSSLAVKPNQVIRVAFTLTMGEDLSGTSFEDNISKISVSNKDEGLKALAIFNERSDKKVLLENNHVKNTHNELYTKIQDTIIPQIEFNKAVDDFNKAIAESEKAPQGDYIKDGRFITINKKGYSTWSNFDWKKRDNTNELIGITFESRGKYNHSNGSTYLSLFDNKGKWHGYINETAVKVSDGKQGAYISDGSYVSITKNYDTWSNFAWKKLGNSKNMINQTFQARGKYNHFNGSTYLSLFDNKGKWHGYINADATKKADGQQGNYIKDGRYVAITKNYDTWSSFTWKKLGNSKNMRNQTFQARGKYNHFNGSTYLSLFDSKGKWFGYINESATSSSSEQQGPYISDGRKVTVIKNNYTTWTNFNWKKRGSSNQMVGKTFTAKGKYHHFNGDTYYSLFDNNGKWYGYLNSNATK